MRVLITGASGFVGSQCAKHFIDQKWEVIGIGRKPYSELPSSVRDSGFSATQYFSFDLSLHGHDSAWNRLAKEIGAVDVVVHAAALSSPWGTESEFWTNNVRATENVLQLAERLNCSKFLFISSSSVFYKEADQYGLSEADTFASPAVNYYAASKQAAENLVRSSEMPFCILRPRAVYGVGDTVLFPRILRAAMTGRFPLIERAAHPVVGDLLSIQNLVYCCAEAVRTPSLVGEFNLTDNNPVEIVGFLLDVFDRLGIPKPKRKLSASTAYRIAGMIESFYRFCLPNREPPITKFGVHVFAYSKTFNVTKMIETFGKPRHTVGEEVEAFCKWVMSEEDPYGLRKARR